MNETLLAPAARMGAIGFSDIVKIRNRVLEMIARGQRVIRLEGGEPFMPTPAHIKDAMKRALDENQTRYAPSSGIPQLLDAIRQKLATRNGIPAATEHIIVTAGGLHGLFCAFQAAVNPGDEVIYFSPYWTPIRDSVTFCGGVPVPVPWYDFIDRDDVAAVLQPRVTDRTRVLYVNTPSNPNGIVLSRAQLQSIAAFAAANHLIVISDEAYEDLVYDGAEHVSLASLPDMFPRTISVYTFSKSYAMTGWRIGYVTADAHFMAPLRKLVLNTVNGVSTPTQFAAVAAVSHGFAGEWIDEYRRRRDMLVGGLAEAGFRCAAPRGAFYLFADVRDRLGSDSWKAMETLLQRTSIASVPGIVFGAEGEGHLRMTFSQPLEILEQAVEALKKC